MTTFDKNEKEIPFVNNNDIYIYIVEFFRLSIDNGNE